MNVFDIFPGADAEESLERAFAASRRAYRLASHHLSVDVVRSPEFDDIMEAIPEFGEAGIHLLSFYAAKAQSDVRAGIGPKHRAESAGCTTPDYEPWNDLGLYIPGSFAHVESSEDGSEWLRIGDLAPIQAGIGEGVPDQIGTLLISRERVIRRAKGRHISGLWHYQAAFIPGDPSAIGGLL